MGKSTPASPKEYGKPKLLSGPLTLLAFGLLFEDAPLGGRLDSSCLVTTSNLGEGGGGRLKVCLGALVPGLIVAGGGGEGGDRVGRDVTFFEPGRFENFCAFDFFVFDPSFFFNWANGFEDFRGD